MNTSYYSPEEIEQILKKNHSVFFIGIGGISMSSLAYICLESGLKVGGSDRVYSDVCKDLSEKGAVVFDSHDEKNVLGYSTVVYTAAIHPDNPEYGKALSLGLPLISRADFLGYIISKYKASYGIAGTHGKSTTTAMAGRILTVGGKAPTVLNGAVIHDIGSSYQPGSFDHLCFEACEYTDSFLSFFPSVAVVINAEYDHPDYFKTQDSYFQSFKKYISQSPAAIVNKDIPRYGEITEGYTGELWSVSVNDESADVYASDITEKNGKYSFTANIKGTEYCSVSLNVFGRHNVSNALFALTVAYMADVSGEAASEALRTFKGAVRRFQYAGGCNGAEVYDDYAHHPTEIKTSLHSAKTAAKGKVYVVYQPHTYSRTAELYSDFITSFTECDEVIFADIYPARETDTLGMSAQRLASDTPKAKYLGGNSAIAAYLKGVLKEGDICVVMGAGDIIKLTPDIIG